MQTILHVGFPKTATTTLQTHVFPDLPALTYAGKLPYESSNTPLARGFGMAHHTNPEKFAAVRTALVSALRKAGEGADHLFLSYEEVTYCTVGPPMVRRETGEVIPALTSEQSMRNAVSAFLEAGLPAPRMIFTLRDQADLLSSYYAQSSQNQRYNKSPLTDSFARYVETVLTRPDLFDPDNLDYLRLGQIALDQGARDVRFICHDWLSRDPARYAAAWAEALGIDAAIFAERLARSRPENVRRHVSGSGERLKINPTTFGMVLDDMKARLLPHRSLGIGRRLKNWFGHISLRGGDYSPDIADIARIRAHYRAANERLVERHPDFASMLKAL